MNYKISNKNELEQFIYTNWNSVNSFIDTLEEKDYLPIYSSCDIRESRNKYAPVDLNIYPAGFNNLCSQDLSVCGKHFRNIIEAHRPGCQKIFLIPESHTKNLFYLDNLYYLQKALTEADYDVSIVSLDEELMLEDKIELISKSEFPLIFHKGIIENEMICIASDKTSACLAILNNDQSKPLNIKWDQLKTLVVPSPKIGWFRREKNNHFNHYRDVLNGFCNEFSIDPNLMQARFKTAEQVDFNTKEGLDKLANLTDELIAESGENKKVFIKASQGTYGMGIMIVNSGEEVLTMNRKKRNKMDIGKNKIKFTSVLLQEGVETMVSFDGMPAEVTIYLIGGRSIGGFMRGNPNRSDNENLNSQGMVYQKFCISEIQENKDDKIKESVYSTIARLASVAAAREIKDVSNE